MHEFEFSDKKIIHSWYVNAGPWIQAIEDNAIASRRLVTDGAIVDAVTEQQPASVLDIGCGEGWLARVLAARGVQVTGVDIVPALIEQACSKASQHERYRLLSYEALEAGKLPEQFDVLVCNFSLIGKESVEAVFAAASRLLNPGGHLIVQTLHPLVACGDGDYRDGWRAGSWAGFGGAFRDPAPWYFRTLGSWLTLLHDSGLRLVQLREPLHPDTGQPASLILVASN